MSLLQAAFMSIDASNAEDPNQVGHEGHRVAKELLYSQRMTHMLDSFVSNPSEALMLACRAQHIRRWELPRDTFPTGRTGYLTWRAELLKRHALTARSILANVGYDDDTIKQVCELLLKKVRAANSDSQVLEDVACLVFLRFEINAFMKKHDEEKLITILQKTWKKMSKRAKDTALTLELLPTTRALVERAVE